MLSGEEGCPSGWILLFSIGTSIIRLRIVKVFFYLYDVIVGYVKQIPKHRKAGFFYGRNSSLGSGELIEKHISKRGEESKWIVLPELVQVIALLFQGQK